MCGFVGLVGVPHAAPALAMGLHAIQHRGQDAAGLGMLDAGRLHLFKELGLVSAALPPEIVQAMPGHTGIGHVRYPTLGGSSREDAQPFMTRRPGILLAHNGNLVNLPALEARLRLRGTHLMSRCDSEPILLVLAEELDQRAASSPTVDDLAGALSATMAACKGSYACVAALELAGVDTLIAFRDPHGIRPAVYGRRDDGAWMAASESVALDVLGFSVVGHVPAGAVVVLQAGQPPLVRQLAPATPHHCVFERIYFARPDSMMEDGRVNDVRWRLGEQLARVWQARGLSADVIVAVPDTSRPAAMAMSEQLGIPNREGFIKNRYSGRTFIMPDALQRDAALRLKLNVMDEVFRGKRVILVDDSIVRGTTMRRIVTLVRACAPAEIHLAVFSPPVRHACFYGIDMPSSAELVAGDVPPADLEDRLRAHLGVDSVTYLSLDDLTAVTGPSICAACFTGHYVVPVDAQEVRYIVDARRGA